MFSPKIGIIDYEMGNLQSIVNALNEIGIPACLVSDPQKIKSYEKIILPGVGAFKKAMKNIIKNGLVDALNEYKQTGKSILGICLGMQLMCTSSTEDGFCQGLNWIDAKIEEFPEKIGYTVPHIGWNSVEHNSSNHLFTDIGEKNDFYFVHSFRVSGINHKSIIGTTHYTDNFCSAFSDENIFGVQFHPEKSQGSGLRLLENFASLKC